MNSEVLLYNANVGVHKLQQTTFQIFVAFLQHNHYLLRYRKISSIIIPLKILYFRIKDMTIVHKNK